MYKVQIDDAFIREQEFHKLHKATVGLEWYEEDFLPNMLDYLNQYNHVDCTNNNKPIRKLKPPKYEQYGQGFRQILKEYCDLVDEKIKDSCYTNQERAEHLLLLEPKIKEYVDKLGTAKIRALGYNMSSMKQSIYQSLPEVQRAIVIEIESNFNKNVVYTSKEIKDFLQILYNKIDYKKSAKATDLDKFFNLEKKKRKIDGKAVDSIIFLN